MESSFSDKIMHLKHIRQITELRAFRTPILNNTSERNRERRRRRGREK